jgi:hypothetical protein
MVDTTTQFSRFGGEITQTSKSVVFRNAQPNLVAPAKGSEFTSLDIPSSILGLSTVKFETIVAYFERKGVSQSLARTYGMALIEAAITTGQDVTDLIDLNTDNPNILSNDTLTHLNFFRNKTSQIGYNLADTDLQHQALKRTIFP